MEEAEGRIKAAEGVQDVEALAAEEERKRKERQEAIRRAEEATAIRLKPFGADRRCNRSALPPSSPPFSCHRGAV